MTKSLPESSDLKVVNPGAGATWLEGTNSGWNTANNGSWTLEKRLKFDADANANGFALWLGTDNDTILVEIYGNRTQDSGGETFNVAHNNPDGAFHTFRIANDAANGRYHVWRDGIRLTPVDGVVYDNGNNESRLIFGDYTGGIFGNNFNATIDYVRYDQTDSYLPPGADADSDGMTDAWEYQFFPRSPSVLPRQHARLLGSWPTSGGTSGRRVLFRWQRLDCAGGGPGRFGWA